MENAVIIIVLALILGGAAFYVYRAKKSGKKCIGCPESSSDSMSGCSGNCSCCSCSSCGGSYKK